MNKSQTADKKQKTPSTLRRVGAYAAIRILTIAITIVLGIFFTVIVANKNHGIDISVTESLYSLARQQVSSVNSPLSTPHEDMQRLIDERHAELMEEAGLNDPFFIKHLRWTWNALRLDLGEGVYTRARAVYVIQQDRGEIRNVILDRLPNTLMIIGMADLLVFVIGIPLSLYLSRNYGGWFDKILNVLSPLSSVPSWVHGVLLILIFSITFKMLPPGGMVDIPMPETSQAVFMSRIKHMIMPVAAIFLSLLFQLVYSWRNYFMIYSNEDYVEFATAMGLSPGNIQRKFILRPSLPYVLTSFALTLVSFWQMATALEIVFNWDGIGKLYIISLPNFWGESMFPGEMGLTLGIVVIFAYLLGIIVLLLDVAYALVDPRIRLGGNQDRIKASRIHKREPFTKRMKALFTSGHAVTAKLLTLGIVLVVIGTLGGLLIGWETWPVDLANVTPADMHYNFRLDYMRLIIDSFRQNEDSALATLRLDALGDDTDQILRDLMTQLKGDTEFQNNLNFFAAEYDRFAAAPRTEDTASTIILNETANQPWLMAICVITTTLLASAAGFYFFIVKNRERIGSQHLAGITVFALIIGITMGIIFAWQVWPVKITNATPEYLSQNYQIDYLCMTIDSFNKTQDHALARMRLDALGEDVTPTLQYVIEHPDAIASSEAAIRQFASTFDANIPGAAIIGIPESAVEEEEKAGLQIGSLTISPWLLAGGCILLVGVVVGVRNAMQPRKTPALGTQKYTLQARLEQWEKRWKGFLKILRQLGRYKSAVVGMLILALMIAGSLYAVIAFPYSEIGLSWYTDASENSKYVPQTAQPVWINWFRKNDLPETIVINSTTSPETKTVKVLDNGNKHITFTFTFDYPYQDFPEEATLYFETNHIEKKPFATFIWTTPDGREFQLANYGIMPGLNYRIEENINLRDLADHAIQYKYSDNDSFAEPVLHGLFMDPKATIPRAVPGKYTLQIDVSTFEPDNDVDVEMVLMGKVYGAAGTDFMRRNLLVPLLWGMPFALVIGLFGALLTTIVSMTFAAFGVWFGGWADNLVQRVTEANMILPVVAIAVLFYAFYGASLWTILTIIVILNAFGSPTKTFRAAFIQVKQSPYIEAAQAYGAPNSRIIFRYMIPRILPVLIPQLVTLVPGFIFLEATLGMFNVKSILPTWGKVIYEALSHGAAWGSRFWVLEPITLLLLTGFAFSMMGFALDRVLNPRLQNME